MQSRQAETHIGHYENFPVASLLCPPQWRVPIAAIYHFARQADDLADEGEATADERLRDLASYRAQLRLAATDAPASAFAPRWATLFLALQRALQRYALPLNLLEDLLDAFAQDIAMTRDGACYADEAALRDYCRRSANPVGRLLLHLYGITDAGALQRSDAICSALQLINFWQDPSVDIPRGRHYVSDEACARHGVSRATLCALRSTPATRQLLHSCADAARTLMLSGAPLVHQIPGRAGWELRLVVQGGLRILDKIAALDYATLEQRPVLGTRDYGRLLWRAAWM